MSRYQKGKTNLDFTEARESEWQWHQLGYMQVCISVQTDNHASTPRLAFLQAGCPSCRLTNSAKALKAMRRPQGSHKPQTPSAVLPPGGGAYFKRPKSSPVRPLACNWYYCAQLIAKPKAARALLQLRGDVEQLRLMSKYDD